MERLTSAEWQAVLSGLEREMRYAWDAASRAMEFGYDQYVPMWVMRIKAAKSVYDRVFYVPLVNDEPDETQYPEPYEPVYQEPDSFYAYDELSSEPGEYPDGTYDEFGSSLD